MSRGSTATRCISLSLLLLFTLLFCACGGSGSKDEDEDKYLTPDYTLTPSSSFMFQASGSTRFEITHSGAGPYSFDLIKNDAGPWLFLARGEGTADIVHDVNLPGGDYFLEVTTSGSWEVNIYTD